jgi:capsular polysaccharide biosynthesis protein
MSGTALCLRSRGAAAFYHFLIEGISRFSVLKPWVELCDWILVTGPRVGWKEEWLELAGIPSAKIIWASGLTHLTFDHVVFSSPFLSEQQPTPDHIDRLRALFPIGCRPILDERQRPFLYISRADARARQWQDEAAFLKAYPWIRPIAPADLSAREQVRQFSMARGIVGVHGSGLANLAFASDPFWVVELFPEGRFVPMYGRLAEAAGGKHIAVSLSGNWAQDQEHLASAISLSLEHQLDSSRTGSNAVS